MPAFGLAYLFREDELFTIYECVGQTIQDSPWEVSVESVIGYEFVRDMQIKKTKIFPPSREAIPIVGWIKYMGETAHPNHDDDFYM